MDLGYFRKQNGIDLYGPYVSQTKTLKGSSVSIYGLTTSETRVGYIRLVERGVGTYLQTGDILDIETRLWKQTGIGGGTASVKFRLGTSNSISDTQIGIFTGEQGTPASNTIVPLIRTIWTSGTYSYVMAATDNTISDWTGSNWSKTSIDVDLFDTSNNVYLSVWSQLSSGSVTASCQYISCKIIPGKSYP